MACPEGIHAYNIYGRSATDNHDQGQKKLNTSERRTLREGVKGGLFVLDVLFTNGHIMQVDLAEGEVPIWKLKKKYTKAAFCDQWAQQIMQSAAPVRRRRTGSMVLADASQATLNSFISPLSQSSLSSSGMTSEEDLVAHTLIDTGEFQRQTLFEMSNGDMRRACNKRKRGASHGGAKGVCGFESCEVPKPKFPRNKCTGCNKYYHLSCFFKTHVATCMNFVHKMIDVSTGAPAPHR